MSSSNTDTDNPNRSKNTSKKYLPTFRNIPFITSIIFVTIIGFGTIYYLRSMTPISFGADTSGADTSVSSMFSEETWKEITSRTGINSGDSPNISKLFTRNIGIFAFLAISVASFYYMLITNISNMSLYIYGLAILIPILLIFSGVILINDTSISFTKNLQTFIGIFIAFMSVGYFYEYGSRATTGAIGYISQLVFAGIIVTGLAILYYFFMDYLRRQSGATGFFITLLFYIPCLFSDFIKYFKSQLKITPSVVSILFILEILLVAAYIYIPKITAMLLRTKSTLLLARPVFLNSENNIAGANTFLLTSAPRTALDRETTYINSNYAVSFWAFVNQGSQSQSGYSKSKNIDGNIFNYAGGKPRMIYKNYNVENKDDSQHRNKFIVYFSNNNPEASKYELTLPIQKWNYFVFNYYDNKADLYVNGEIEHTFVFDKNNTPIDGRDTDIITVGENNGLAGAICNVNYYKQPIPESYITTEYNLYYKSSPPVPYV